MKIGVFVSDYQVEKPPFIHYLFDKLNQLGAKLFIKREFYEFLINVHKYSPPIAGILDQPALNLDIALSVGGDGTFLRTAAQISNQLIPILGINTGRLGFLADVGEDQIEETLNDLFQHNYKVEERMLLELQTTNYAFERNRYALNEVAVLKRDTSSMITIHTFLNDEYLTSYQADGLVIATPTGSTAYSMSVNGPIVLPSCNNIVLSPVAPHSLNVRPLVIPDTHRITLNVESRSQSFLVSLDGSSEVLPVGVDLSIGKSDFKTRIIKRHNQTFYQTLREKLMWGVDKRVK